MLDKLMTLKQEGNLCWSFNAKGACIGSAANEDARAEVVECSANGKKMNRKDLRGADLSGLDLSGSIFGQPTLHQLT